MTVLVCAGRAFRGKKKLRQVLDYVHAKTPITTLVSISSLDSADPAAIWATEAGVERVAFSPDGVVEIRNNLVLNIHKPDLLVMAGGSRGASDLAERVRDRGIQVIMVP